MVKNQYTIINIPIYFLSITLKTQSKREKFCWSASQRRHVLCKKYWSHSQTTSASWINLKLYKLLMIINTYENRKFFRGKFISFQRGLNNILPYLSDSISFVCFNGSCPLDANRTNMPKWESWNGVMQFFRGLFVFKKMN